MNVHIMLDNFYTKRFMEYLAAYFPADEHAFIILSVDPHKCYVDRRDRAGMLVLDIWRPFFRLRYLNDSAIRAILDSASNVFIHFLNNWGSFILMRYCSNDGKEGKGRRIIWLPWGGDFYDFTELEQFSAETHKLMGPVSKSGTLKKVLKRKIFFDPWRKRAIARVDLIAGDFRSEYDIIKHHYDTGAEYRKFFYPNPLNFQKLRHVSEEAPADWPELDAVKECSKLVLVGNSGYPSNNHADVLQMLSGIESCDFGVVCPLSYGRPAYIEKVIAIGRELLGDRFVPLTEFMAADRYFQLLRKTDTAIMNHFRQQGKGNIIPLIYLGKKVYLREAVTTYREYAADGIRIESTDSLLSGNVRDMLTPYPDEIKITNRNIITERYSDENARKNMERLFK